MSKIVQTNKNTMLERLYFALDNLKHKSILADTMNTFNTWKYYKDFNWNLFETKSDNPIMKLTIGNDFDSEEQIEDITFKLDDIIDINIDDNLNCNNDLNNLNEPYYVENIIITLWNESKLRLELQW